LDLLRLVNLADLRENNATLGHVWDTQYNFEKEEVSLCIKGWGFRSDE